LYRRSKSRRSSSNCGWSLQGIEKRGWDTQQLCDCWVTGLHWLLCSKIEMGVNTSCALEAAVHSHAEYGEVLHVNPRRLHRVALWAEEEIVGGQRMATLPARTLLLLPIAHFCCGCGGGIVVCWLGVVLRWNAVADSPSAAASGYCVLYCCWVQGRRCCDASGGGVAAPCRPQPGGSVAAGCNPAACLDALNAFCCRLVSQEEQAGTLSPHLSLL
jgi:hypothetical protein